MEFAGRNPRISLGLGITINAGNWEAAKAYAGMEIDALPGEDVDALYGELAEELWGKLESNISILLVRIQELRKK